MKIIENLLTRDGEVKMLRYFSVVSWFLMMGIRFANVPFEDEVIIFKIKIHKVTFY